MLPRFKGLGIGDQEAQRRKAYSVNSDTPWKQFRLRVIQSAGTRLASMGIPFTITPVQEQPNLHRIETIETGEEAMERVFHAPDIELLSRLHFETVFLSTSLDPRSEIGKVKGWSAGVKNGVYRAFLLRDADFWRDSASEERVNANEIEAGSPIAGYLLGFDILPVRRIQDQDYYQFDANANRFSENERALRDQAEQLMRNGAIDITPEVVGELIQKAVDRELGTGRYGKHLARRGQLLQQATD